MGVQGNEHPTWPVRLKWLEPQTWPVRLKWLTYYKDGVGAMCIEITDKKRTKQSVPEKEKIISDRIGWI